MYQHLSTQNFEMAKKNDQCGGQAQQQPDSLDNLKILLVDDNVDAAQALALLLEALGYKVSIEYGPFQAIERSKNEQFDVYLLDIGMPKMNGYELVGALRKLVNVSHVRFAALTGYGLQSDKHTAFDAGFHAHFTKPANIGELISFFNEISPKAAKSRLPA